MAPILDLGAPVSLLSIVPWNKLIATAGGGISDAICQDNIIRNLYNLNLKNYSASTYQESFTKMAEFFAQYPGGRNSSILFEFFPNQAIAAVPLDDTAFPWRDSTAYV